MTHRLLLVEGEGDKEFFTQILTKHLPIYQTEVIEIKVPKQQGAIKNGKQYVRKEIVKYIQENSDKDYRLACVIDADYHNTKWGNIANPNNAIPQTLQLYINDNVKINTSYNNCQQHPSTGYYLESNDGLSNVGIWFMPNNQDEGMLENWLLTIADNSEKPLLQYAETVCKDVITVTSPPKFDPAHFCKAQVGVWTALQETPHLGTENIIKHTLYDKQSSDFKNFIAWLKFIYQ